MLIAPPRIGGNAAINWSTAISGLPFLNTMFMVPCGIPSSPTSRPRSNVS